MATRQQAKGFRFELFGVKELEKMLSQLPTAAMQKSVLRKSLKKSLVKIKTEAEQDVPVGKTGNLKKSIKVTSALTKSQKGIVDRSKVYMYVGSTAPHAHLIEFGTVEREKKDGRTTGLVQPVPFLRKAWESGKRNALKIFTEEMQKNLLKAATLLSKKAVRGTLTAKQRAGFGG